jgi:Ca2+-binding EF-hand superfamily protein
MHRSIATSSKSWIATVLFAAVSFIAMPASAQETDVESAMHWFDDMDNDRDGAITAEEIITIESRQARRMDADGDGRLTLEEFNFGIPADRTDVIERRTRRFGVMDTDLDGFVTAAESKAFAERVIVEADQDGDARVTRAEFEAGVSPPQ